MDTAVRTLQTLVSSNHVKNKMAAGRTMVDFLKSPSRL